MNRELHYRYAISYLVLGLILLLALAYYDVPNLVDRLSFALTLSSLLLSILAIFYTITSAQHQDDRIAKLVETHASLEMAAAEIKRAAQDVKVFADDAPRHFARIGSRLDEMAASYQAVYMAVPEEDDPSPNAKGKAEDQFGDNPIEIDDRTFQLMFGRLVFGAMAVLYLFQRVERKNQVISRELLKELNYLSFDYAIGVLNGLSAIGLLSFKLHEEAIIPVHCAEVVPRNIDKNISVVHSVIGDQQFEWLGTVIQAVNSRVP